MFCSRVHRNVTIFTTALSRRHMAAASLSEVEAKVHALGLKLPEPGVPKGNFAQFIRVGNLAYLSGHLPQPEGKALIVGKIGKDLTEEQGYEAAKYTGLNLCATLKANVGSLDKVKRIIKVTGFVNGTSTFGDQAKVVNGCSDLFSKIFDQDKVSRHFIFSRRYLCAIAVLFNILWIIRQL